MKFDLEQFIFALSDTVDLVGVDEILHGKRVGFMAWECGRILGCSSAGRRRLLQLGMLHDCGVSSTEERNHLVQQLEWENSHVHCLKGAERMEYFAPLQTFATPIAYHHTRWEELADRDLDEDAKREANLIFLLDRVDYLCQNLPGRNLLTKRDTVRHKIKSFSGTYFNDELVETFLDVSANEAFWFALEPVMLMDFIHQQKKNRQPFSISLSQLQTVAELFAEIVDAKSPYTAEHSFGVANLSRHLAALTGIDKEVQKKVAIAGLLHDLGKLQVPDRVLEHRGPLDQEELSYMRHHSYITYRILDGISGFQEVAKWAGNHHEALDGSGYPFRKTAVDLSIESRIVAVADIFQALAQARPYRQPQPVDTILTFLKNNADRGRLDAGLVATVIANSDSCYQVAVSV